MFAHVTQHTYGTWFPDRPQGFVRHGRGLQRPDPELAGRYRRLMRGEPTWLEAAHQRALIESVIQSCEIYGWTPRSIATDASHFHACVETPAVLDPDRVRVKLRRSATYALNAAFGRRTWWTAKGHGKRLTAERSGYLVTSYHPRHSGWVWSRERGWRPPIRCRSNLGASHPGPSHPGA